uniref:Uncharacterized protein n=1 Tax=viral metagenome TaxID=1070528 RepID=A0A6C0CE75_9ZZZZ
MIFNESIFSKLLVNRNLNIIVHGNDTRIFNSLKLDKKVSHNIEYSESNDIYLIDNKPTKKIDLINLIIDFTSSPNFYNSEIRKKVFILLNVQNLNKSLTLKIKSIAESSYETSSFIIHSKRINQLDINIRNRFLIFSLPIKAYNDETIMITYQKLLKFIGLGLNKKTIEDIRELCYMYYMNHNSSIELQQYIVKKICKSITLPNKVKYNAIEDIVDVNHLYGYSYRKPLYLEYIIYSLFKHLEYYTI